MIKPSSAPDSLPAGASSCTVVTGAAGGIGEAVVRKLVARGERIVAVDLDADRLESRFGGDPQVFPLACDLTSDEGFGRLTGAVKSRFAAVRGFVHAAGFDRMEPLGMVAPDSVARLVAVHAAFPLRFLGWLSRRGNHVDGTACVLVSSLAAHEGAKGHAAYAAAKGAVEGMLGAAASELAERGVRLNAVVLGIVETAMAHDWLDRLSPEQYRAIVDGYPLGLGKPEQVADAVLFLLSGASSWITGQTLVCDGGHSIR